MKIYLVVDEQLDDCHKKMMAFFDKDHAKELRLRMIEDEPESLEYVHVYEAVLSESTAWLDH